MDLREPQAQGRDDLRGLVDREGRLGDVRQLGAGRNGQCFGVLDRLDEHGRLGRLAHRPDDLLVALVSDQDNCVAGGGVPPRLNMDLRDERTRRVDRVQP
jgi:hypothetical protein